jgi:hypothetical protein
MELYKKCEVCGTNINKLQNWFNIYLLKTGIKLKCPNCETEYKTNKFISFIGNFYTWSGISLFVLLGCTVMLDKLFKKNFGGEVWLYAFIILSIVNFIVMVILPLNKVENKKEGE